MLTQGEATICPSCNASWCDEEKDDTLDEEEDEKENAKADESSDNRSANGTYAENISKGLMIGGAVVALPCIAASVAGFGVAGVVGGSAAAVWQSAIGNVAAGSLFATLQSLGATGVFVTGSAVGTSAAGAGLATKLLRKKEQGHESNNGTPSDCPDELKSNNGTIVCPNCHAEFLTVGLS